MTAIKVHFDGRSFIPDEPVNVPVDQPAVVYVEEAAPLQPGKGTFADLLNSGLVGIWKDRTDIGDSLEFARKLRQQAETRHHEIHDPS